MFESCLLGRQTADWAGEAGGDHKRGDRKGGRRTTKDALVQGRKERQTGCSGCHGKGSEDTFKRDLKEKKASSLPRSFA